MPLAGHLFKKKNVIRGTFCEVEVFTYLKSKVVIFDTCTILNDVYFLAPLKCNFFFIISNDCFFGDE